LENFGGGNEMGVCGNVLHSLGFYVSGIMVATRYNAHKHGNVRGAGMEIPFGQKTGLRSKFVIAAAPFLLPIFLT
jgi:hypothetical protein